MIGEPDAGKPHVRFDEGVQETYDTVTRLRPTLRLAVSTLNVELSDPAATYLLDCLIEYIQGEDFSPQHTVKPEIISKLIRSKR